MLFSQVTPFNLQSWQYLSTCHHSGFFCLLMPRPHQDFSSSSDRSSRVQVTSEQQTACTPHLQRIQPHLSLHPQIPHGPALSPVKITRDFTLLYLSYLSVSGASQACPVLEVTGHPFCHHQGSQQHAGVAITLVPPLQPFLSETSSSPLTFAATELPDGILCYFPHSGHE